MNKNEIIHCLFLIQYTSNEHFEVTDYVLDLELANYLIKHQVKEYNVIEIKKQRFPLIEVW